MGATYPLSCPYGAWIVSVSLKSYLVCGSPGEHYLFHIAVFVKRSEVTDDS